MHSIYQRFNNLTALLSSCLLALLGAVALSSFIFTANPKGTLAISSLKVHPGDGLRGHYRQSNREHSFVKFNVSADLTPLFNWNTKQLFIYLDAEYTSVDGTRNEVVIWDRIVRRKEDAVINVHARSKYRLRDMAKTFKNVSPAHYALKYNIMPYVGVLTYGEAARTEEAIKFPLSKDVVS